MTNWLQLVGGGVLLYLGAEWFVGGASTLALALRIPQLLIGLTVVAYGTSAPEVIVGIQAARAGHGEVALGNVLGSNITNIGLILGIATLVRPARVDGSLRRREIPVLIGSAGLVPLLLFDGRVGRDEAAGLVLCAVGYTAWMVYAARGAATLAEARSDARVTRDAADMAGAPRPTGAARAGGIAAVGLTLLLLGGKFFVDAAVSVAAELGMSERLVGLTIVAVGTSLPELVTSVIAAYRGHSDLAVGNVVGSNIFNVLLCLGAAGLAGDVGAPVASLFVDLVALGGMTVMAVVFMRTARSISRFEGAVALATYAAFMTVVAVRG
jgi:cation:H+ antiporter